jgi:hypothetical protein
VAVDGGRVAARGFQYQYLRTVEALLVSLGEEQVAACRIEGSGDPVSLQRADAVDFDLVDSVGRSLMAVQVKSAGAGRVVRAREAVSVLLHLITGVESREYRLITSAAPDEGSLRLAETLRSHGDDPARLKAEIKKQLVRSPAVWGKCEALSTEEWQRLGRSSIEFDGRVDTQVREDLNSALRRHREQAGHGLSHRSGGLVLGYLVAEVMRRAADPALARWDVEDFQQCVRVDDGELIEAVGRQDYGLIYGQMPIVPEVERPELVKRLAEALGLPAAGSDSVRVCVVTGLSGLGKSSLAAAHVADKAFRYDAIFWVEAETEESLIASFARVLAHLTGSREPADATDPRLLRERVHAQLQSLPGPWLMVFDDAHARSARRWLPRRGRGHVIVTSLGGAWSRVDGRVELGPMSGDESVQLLRLRMGLTEDESAAHEASLLQLARTLAYWPLAIEVACGYLVSCGIPVDRLHTYTDTLVSRAANDEDSVPSGYPRTLSAAVALSIDRLIRGARARNLVRPTLLTLAALCWLAPRRAPVHLALAGAFVTPEDLPPAPGWLVFDEAHLPVREVVRELLNVSLVRYDEPLPARSEVFPGSEDTISMNAVLQFILAQQLDLSEISSVALPLMACHTDRWLRGAIETGQAERAWELAQHASALIRHIEATQTADTYTSALMGNLAGLYLVNGRYKSAQELLERELEWLHIAGDPDEGLAAQTHSVLARIAQVRQRPDVVEQIIHHLRPVLAYLQQLTSPPTPPVANLAIEAAVILQNQLRIAASGPLDALLRDFWKITESLPSSETSYMIKDLAAVQELLSDGAADRAEQIVAMALARSTDPWSHTTVDLKRMLVEALVTQHKWPEADAALTQFLPYTGPRTLYGFSVHHLVHNVGCACAWQWVTIGEPQAIELLGRLLNETAIRENPAIETPTDQARFLLLDLVYTGWKAMSKNSRDSDFLDLMAQLNDATFTDPHEPDSVWERIYYGLQPRLSAVARDRIHEDYQAEGDAIMADSGNLLREDSVASATYEAGACEAVLALSSDPLYGILAGRSTIDLLLPEARHLLPDTKPLVILQPNTMIGATSIETGNTIEVQIHRACAKGLRLLSGPMPTLSCAEGLTLTLTGHDLVLEHSDGTILARASVRASGQWRDAARARGTAALFYGYGFNLRDRTAHRRLMATPADLADQIHTSGEQGLLAAALVSVRIQSSPAPPDARRRTVTTVRQQPRRSTRSSRKKMRAGKRLHY